MHCQVCFFIFPKWNKGTKWNAISYKTPILPIHYITIIYNYPILLFKFFYVPIVPLVPLYIIKYVIMYVLYINKGFWEFLQLILGGTSPGTTKAAARSSVPLRPLSVIPSGGPHAPGLFHFGSCSTRLVPPGTQKVARILQRATKLI